TEEAGAPFAGLDRREARDAAVKELEEDGLLVKVEPYQHNVGFSERADVPIEPYLSEQWFMRHPQVPRGIGVVERGDIRFHPERWIKTYTHWMTNIKDWCLSRQLWWGHRIPVWYRKDSRGAATAGQAAGLPSRAPGSDSLEACPTVYVGVEPPPDPENWEQDPDVLDTWFSSWLWPFATMGWPEKTATLQRFYPTTDLVTGPDIIFLWVARMIMAGHQFMDAKPFGTVYFTGIIRDALGRKMSKSLGNSPDPLDLIDHYGADGLRFGLMLIAPQGQDILFDEKRCEVGRNFMNKLWNAARFIQLQRAGNPAGAALTIHDRKIIHELNDAIAKVSLALDGYRFNEAVRELYEFVWGDFCDWYIETSKGGANLTVLDGVFSAILRLLHPFAPFITEELWHDMGYGDDTIQFAPWPGSFMAEEGPADLAAEVDALYACISAGRQLRNDYRIEPRQQVTFAVKPSQPGELWAQATPAMQILLNAEQIIVDERYQPDGLTPSIVTPAATIFMIGAVDVAAERQRLTKQLADLERQLRGTEAKLANENFVGKAAPVAVQREQDKQAHLGDQRDKVQALLQALG
ncbi:class I tRNA ligase family protein, partial [bacterium]|nr:class I tRNA ligase family protein [bacterium]